MEKREAPSFIKWTVIGSIILLISEWEATKKAAKDAWQGKYEPVNEASVK